MQINCFIWIADKPTGDDESAVGAIMHMNTLIQAFVGVTALSP